MVERLDNVTQKLAGKEGDPHFAFEEEQEE